MKHFREFESHAVVVGSTVYDGEHVLVLEFRHNSDLSLVGYNHMTAKQEVRSSLSHYFPDEIDSDA